MRLLLPLPPSDNERFILSRGRLVKSTICRRYEKQVIPLIQAQTAKQRQFIPTYERQVILRYTVTLQNKRRDASNVEKVLKDVLTAACVWSDDKWVVPQMCYPIRVDSCTATVGIEVDYAENIS